MRKLLFIIIILAFYGCQEDVIGINDTEFQQSFEDDLIVPLNLGNSWSYRSVLYDATGTIINEDVFNLEISGVKHFDEKVWYKVQNSEFPHVNLFWNFKIDGLHFRLPDYFGDHEFHKYTFRGEIGDENIYNFREFENNINTDQTTEITDLNSHITLNGITYSCIEYTTNISFIIGGNTNTRTLIEYFSPGIGLIERQYYNTPTELYRSDYLLNYALE